MVAFHRMQRHGDGPDILRALVTAGADLAAQDSEGRTVLRLILEDDQVAWEDAAHIILSAAAESTQPRPCFIDLNDGYDSFRFALDRFDDDGDMVRAIISAGAGVDYCPKGDEPPLVWAVMGGDLVDGEYLDVPRVLIEMGANVEARWEGAVEGLGWTALMSATWYGPLENVEMLLKAGADVFARSDGGLNADLPKHCAQGNALAAAYRMGSDKNLSIRAVLQRAMDRRVAAALSAMPDHCAPARPLARQWRCQIGTGWRR